MDRGTALILILVLIAIFVLVRTGLRDLWRSRGFDLRFRPERQLDYVTRGEFYPKKILNESERVLFWELVTWTRQAGRGLSVLPQVAMGECLGARSAHAFTSINSKRADFVIADAKFRPVAFVEYQGSGHRGSQKVETLWKTSLVRDEIKRLAAEKSGVAFIEVPASFDRAQLHATLSRELGARGPSPGVPPETDRSA